MKLIRDLVNRVFNLQSDLEELNRRLEETVTSRTRWMRELIVQSEKLNKTLTEEEVVVTIGEAALNLSKADGLIIYAPEEEGPWKCLWSKGLSSRNLASLMGESHKSILPETALKSTPILFDDPPMPGSAFAGAADNELDVFRSMTVWPLLYKDQVKAFVGCLYRYTRQVDENEQEILETYFRQSAAALVNAHLYQAEHTQRRLAEALREISATLNSTLDLDRVLEGILENLGQVVPHDTASILLLEDDCLRMARWSGSPERLTWPVEEWRYPIHDFPIILQIRESVEAAIIPDTQADPTWRRFPHSDWIRSYAGAPIYQRGEVTGFINVNSSIPGFYHLETGRILQVFANQAAIALQNARLYENTSQRFAEANALYRALEPLFNPAGDLEGLAKQITRSVTEEFDSAHCSILLVDEANIHLVEIAQSGQLRLNVPDMPLDGPGLTVDVVRTGKIIYSPDVKLNPRYVAGSIDTRSELVIPLHTGSRVIGVLNLESPLSNAFDENAQRLLVSFAERAALSLENTRLFATIRKQAAQMEQLNDITQTVLRISDPREMLHVLARQVTGMMNADGCYITLWDENGNRTIPMAASGPNEENYLDISSQSKEKTLTYSALRLRKTLVVEDVHNSPYVDPALAVDYPVRSILTLPMIADGQRIGAALVGFVETHVFTPEEITLGEQAAGQIALAMSKLHLLELAQRRAQEANILYQSTRQRARELEALQTATTSLVSTLDLQKLLERILSAATSAIPAAESAALHLANDLGQLELRVQQNFQEAETSTEWNLEHSLWDWSLREYKPLKIGSPEEIPAGTLTPFMQETSKHQSIMIAPLIKEERPLGTLTLTSPDSNAFSEPDLHLLISFASTATAAIQNAQLHSAVQYLAITDPLTGVYNRRGFYNLAAHVMEQSRYFHRPLSAVMMDIDFFKKINDQFGHDAGDAVLQMLAERFRKVLREADVICRYGGEEFAILLTESDLAGAEAAAQRLHKVITETPVQTAAGPVTVTMSIGVATFNDMCASLDDLLKFADRALYFAKEQGRNQVYVWRL